MKSASFNQLTALIAGLSLAVIAFMPSSVAFGVFIAAAASLIVLIAIADYAPRRSRLALMPATNPRPQPVRPLTRVRFTA